jgi:hypothetical protein
MFYKKWLGREKESMGDSFFNQWYKIKKENPVAKKKLVVFKGRKKDDFVVKSAKNCLDYEIGCHIEKVNLVHLIDLGFEIDLVGRPK